jgi:methylase of polypeptide subunit release factors
MGSGENGYVLDVTHLSCRFGPLVVDYDERVLTPRPWTLQQSEWAAELAAEGTSGPILELCAGAGHIGLTAAVLAGRDLVQVEADPVAARYAASNAARAGWTDRTEIRTRCLRSAVRPDERFELIIADPPYLRTGDVARWPDDPVTAIDGGADGLDLIRACLSVAAAHLQPAGQLLLQVAGLRQGDQMVLPPSLRRRGRRVVDDERAILLLERR